METPEVVKMLTSDDILDMKQEELKVELEKFGQDVKGLTKVQLQKALLKLIQSQNESLKAKEYGVQAKILKIKLEKEQDEKLKLELKKEQRREEREADRKFDLEKMKIQLNADHKLKLEQAELESRR